MTLHQFYDRLTMHERQCVDECFEDVMSTCARYHVPLSPDDRIERAVDALSQAIINSRGEPLPKIRKEVTAA
jgi:hypothetical protein